MSGTSACCCVLGAHRPRRHSGAASSSCQDAVSLSRSDASAVGRGRSPPSSERGVRWSGLLRRCAESTLGRHLRAQQIAGFYLPRVAHCPGLRCCSPHSQTTVELTHSSWLQRCSVPAFWFPHVLHAPDAVLHGQPPGRLFTTAELRLERSCSSALSG